MVGTRSPVGEEDAGLSTAAAALTAAGRTASADVNEATLDALVVEWLQEEAEKEKVRSGVFLLLLAHLGGSVVMSATRWV